MMCATQVCSSDNYVVLDFIEFTFLEYQSLLKAPLLFFYDLLLCFLLNGYPTIFYNSLLFANHCQVHTIKFFLFNLIEKLNRYPTQEEEEEKSPHILSLSLRSLHFLLVHAMKSNSSLFHISEKHPQFSSFF